MIWGTFALAFAAAFTGASFYVNWVEQPARLKLEDQALLSEWGPSDSRGVSFLIALAPCQAAAGGLRSTSPTRALSSPRHARRACCNREPS